MTHPASVAEVLATVIGPGTPIRFEAFDGSKAGPADALATVEVVRPRALRHLATAPGQLGLARAYVAGDLDVVGDIHQVLELLARESVASLDWTERLVVLRRLGPGVLRPAPPPPEEIRAGRWRGLRHSLRRDSQAISHHYDVSNRFYRWLLGPTMAYTCAVYPTDQSNLEEAQKEKVDLVCRKLGLRSGQRLLDVGCGWGSLVAHAAEHYGVSVLGVTLSRQQAEWGQKRLADLGLAPRAEIRHCDYRQVDETGFDAVASIGLTEHIGAAHLAAYASFLTGRLRPGGRLLNHCITRPTTNAPTRHRHGFIDRYVFPDGELEGVATIIGALSDAGLEIRHEENLREHYARTCAAWSANLAEHWEDAIVEIGPGRARVWQLYLAGSRLGFEQRRIELHQVLAVRTDRGEAAMPLRLDFTCTGRLGATEWPRGGLGGAPIGPAGSTRQRGRSSAS